MNNNLLDTQERIKLDYLAEQTAERVAEKMMADSKAMETRIVDAISKRQSVLLDVLKRIFTSAAGLLGAEERAEKAE